MAGQPDGTLLGETFNVSGITIAEPGESPTTVVPVGSPIDISAAFEGDGDLWDALKFFTAQYNVDYYLDSLGAGVADAHLGTVIGNLTAADAYGAPDTTLNTTINDAGVYHLVCTVTFPSSGVVTGFYELLIQAR